MALPPESRASTQSRLRSRLSSQRPARACVQIAARAALATAPLLSLATSCAPARIGHPHASSALSMNLVTNLPEEVVADYTPLAPPHQCSGMEQATPPLLHPVPEQVGVPARLTNVRNRRLAPAA